MGAVQAEPERVVLPRHGQHTTVGVARLGPRVNPGTRTQKKLARYRLRDLSGFHWSDVSGGVMRRSPPCFLHAYAQCNGMLEGELAPQRRTRAVPALDQSLHREEGQHGDRSETRLSRAPPATEADVRALNRDMKLDDLLNACFQQLMKNSRRASCWSSPAGS